MKANDIAAALQKAKSVDQFHRLTLECDTRRQEIRALLPQIDGREFEGPERLAAVKAGPEALARLNQTVRDLDFELQYLDRLEALVQAGKEEFERAELRRTIPAAVRRIERELVAVREAAAALDDAIARANTTIGVIANYERAGIPFPLSDRDALMTLEVREVVWKKRNLMTLVPPMSATDADNTSTLRAYLEKWKLGYTWRGGLLTYSRRHSVDTPPGEGV